VLDARGAEGEAFGLVPKLDVAGSSPVARSSKILICWDLPSPGSVWARRFAWGPTQPYRIWIAVADDVQRHYFGPAANRRDSRQHVRAVAC
jgi:hypothetical protein